MSSRVFRERPAEHSISGAKDELAFQVQTVVARFRDVSRVLTKPDLESKRLYEGKVNVAWRNGKAFCHAFRTLTLGLGDGYGSLEQYKAIGCFVFAGLDQGHCRYLRLAPVASKVRVMRSRSWLCC